MAANVRFSNPKTLAKPPGYSYVVEATGPNRLIYIAGQLGLDMENRLVGEPGDFRAQANKAVENLKLALADAGATLRDVVKINNYLVDMSHIAIFREVRDAHFNMSAPPASTTASNSAGKLLFQSLYPVFTTSTSIVPGVPRIASTAVFGTLSVTALLQDGRISRRHEAASTIPSNPTKARSDCG